MLYETLSQPTTFLILTLIGFLSGGIFDAFHLLNYFFNKNKITNQLLLFIAMILSFFIFSETNLLVNFGDIRFFTFFSFFGSLIIERFTIGKLFAKVIDKCYNGIIKGWKKFLKIIYGKRKKNKNN